MSPSMHTLRSQVRVRKKKMETAETMAYKWPEKNISVEKRFPCLRLLLSILVCILV